MILGICIENRSIESFRMGGDFSLFLFWNNDITDTKIDTEGCPCVLNPGHQCYAYTSIFLCNGDRRNALDLKDGKIIFCRNGNDLLRHSLDLLRSVGNLTKQEVHIHLIIAMAHTIQITGITQTKENDSYLIQDICNMLSVFQI